MARRVDSSSIRCVQKAEVPQSIDRTRDFIQQVFYFFNILFFQFLQCSRCSVSSSQSHRVCTRSPHSVGNALSGASSRAEGGRPQAFRRERAVGGLVRESRGVVIVVLMVRGCGTQHSARFTYNQGCFSDFASCMRFRSIWTYVFRQASAMFVLPKLPSSHRPHHPVRREKKARSPELGAIFGVLHY